MEDIYTENGIHEGLSGGMTITDAAKGNISFDVGYGCTVGQLSLKTGIN